MLTERQSYDADAEHGQRGDFSPDSCESCVVCQCVYKAMRIACPSGNRRLTSPQGSFRQLGTQTRCDCSHAQYMLMLPREKSLVPYMDKAANELQGKVRECDVFLGGICAPGVPSSLRLSPSSVHSNQPAALHEIQSAQSGRVHFVPIKSRLREA